MVVEQGDLIWVRFPRARGSEPAGRRPALVLQSNAFNRSRINNVVVAAVTSNLRFESVPGNVRLNKGEAGIPKASVVNVSQLHAIDRTYIEARIGKLPLEKFNLVKSGLQIFFDL
ncbi:MAG: type II toxin-antitoxin system PemK/MazF family toxin [Bdellovibrionota bacterium]